MHTETKQSLRYIMNNSVYSMLPFSIKMSLQLYIYMCTYIYMCLYIYYTYTYTHLKPCLQLSCLFLINRIFLSRFIRIQYSLLTLWRRAGWRLGNQTQKEKYSLFEIHSYLIKKIICMNYLKNFQIRNHWIKTCIFKIIQKKPAIRRHMAPGVEG